MERLKDLVKNFPIKDFKKIKSLIAREYQRSHGITFSGRDLSYDKILGELYHIENQDVETQGLIYSFKNGTIPPGTSHSATNIINKSIKLKKYTFTCSIIDFKGGKNTSRVYSFYLKK